MNAVTGAYSYTGKYIARHLLAMDEPLICLTNKSPDQNPFNQPIPTYPLDFLKPHSLADRLKGVTTLYNTYWVRFNYHTANYEQAVRNSRILFEAAKRAGVKRIVQISVSNPARESPLPYFHGKAMVEEALQEMKISYAIIRPTLVYSLEDILINNIAFFLRRFPLFGIAGDGDYRVQPIFVEDLAQITIRAGRAEENIIIDAAGPEVYRFIDLVRLIHGKIHSRAVILHMPPFVVLALSRFLGVIYNDVVLTADELRGLIANLLVSATAPAGWTRFSSWISENAQDLGIRYASELSRHFSRH